MNDSDISIRKLFLPERPEPVPGCERCAELDAERTAAGEAGDGSKVSDCNVLIRQHPKYGDHV